MDANAVDVRAALTVVAAAVVVAVDAIVGKKYQETKALLRSIDHATSHQ